jgi:hypothetical protein
MMTILTLYNFKNIYRYFIKLSLTMDWKFPKLIKNWLISEKYEPNLLITFFCQ